MRSRLVRAALVMELNFSDSVKERLENDLKKLKQGKRSM